jgi:hypothetical protein
MQKSVKTLLCLFSLMICLATSSDVVMQSKAEGVEDVILDKTEAILSCYGLGKNIGYCTEEARKINIHTVAKDAENKDLEFYYLVQGGKVIGRGADVVWDLSDARPGRYLIAVGVGKGGVIKGNLITKSVSVFDCECQPPCTCPTLSVTGPTAPADAGDTLIFTVNLAGGSQDNEVYNWTVSEGKIIVGQQTPQILVKTTPEMKGRTITATVEVSGLCEVCLDKTATATAEIKDK